ncbi:MAG: PQQ-binding-like beta-propeller repeat protein [Verrucomicrobiales bacterium]|nr:PQQ-binding-like beta-propeller repeat protein [Verrucomicrobiales bacterium]
MKSLLLAPCLVSLVCVTSALAAPADDAREVLERSNTPGGLAVVVPCGVGELAMALAEARPALIVHGLESDLKSITEAREKFLTHEAATRLSAEMWKRDELPYAENLVNLLVIGEGTRITPQEAMRVLAPGGTVARLKAGQWSFETKNPTPKEKQWTHYQYDAANNPVGEDDSCGLPRQFQWAGKPLWSTAHESMASLNAMVSANGRVFYIMDEGPRASVQLPSDWNLVARDAYNGVVLWKKPLKQWLTRFWPWKSGPAQMPRKLIAIGDRVYAPLDINGALIEFDAATGEELQVYPETLAAEEVIYTNGILLTVSNPTPPDMKAIEEETRSRRHFSYDGRDRVVLDHNAPRYVVATDAKTGKTLWKHSGPTVSVLTLSSLGDKVIYHDGRSVVCLDLTTGAERWKSAPIAQKTKTLVTVSEEAPTVVLNDKAVYYAWDQKLTTLSMEDGRVLWNSDWVANDYRSPVSVMLMNGLVWSMDITSARGLGTFIGRDLLTGDVREQFDLPPFKGIGHHRCYKAKASGDFVLLSRSGVEYVDPTKQSYDENHWIRGACLYGILPANGMLYSTPHACACYIKGKLNGFTAMTPGPTAPFVPAKDKADPIQTGPAYKAAVESRAQPDDWPTYRHNNERSGRGSTEVNANLKQTWKTPLGGELSSLTVGEGLVLLAQKDRNTVQALNAASGEPVWHFVAGGTIDSPPTISKGFVYFGSGDGCVYALRAGDGALAWRTRAAPGERRVAAYGRLESTWPVHGSVLVQDGLVYASAGRSSFLDGGIRVVKINAETGEIFGSETVYDFDQDGKQPPLTSSFDMAGALPDILSAKGDLVFMRHASFDKESLSRREQAEHIFSPTGYLDDNWWHRTYWVFGDDTRGGYGGWWQVGNKLPAGRLLVFDDKQVYAFGRSFYAGMNAAQFGRGEKYILYASEKHAGEEPNWAEANRQRKEEGDLNIDWKSFRTTPIQWQEELPFHVRAMALAGDTLFAAGPYGDAVRSGDSFEGKRGVRLAAASTVDGELLASYAVDALPVFDGLAAANGRLYLAMTDGSVACFGAEGSALASKLGEAVEILPENLLPDDEEYRKQWQEKLGISDAPAKAKGAGKRVALQGESQAGRFDEVKGGRVVASELGYRLGANTGTVALALHRLNKPVTEKTTWTFKMQRAPGFPNPPHYGNGFFAFGDGPKDEDLVKCGIQFIQSSAVIAEGATNKTRGPKKKLEGDLDAAVDLRVTYDPQAQTVTLAAGESTITHKLTRPLREVNHVGFVTWNAVTDFSALGVE